MEPQIDELGAFVPGARAILEPTGAGPLSDIRFAVKDMFDIAGFITTYGNPDWTRTHAPSVATAPVVATLLRAGARLVGKTITVELAFGLTGENLWHGTPRNPRAPARFPGGSSAGSAAAVAGGLVDLALGSDTGGSVRVPASYCGIFGIRPTQGAIGLAGTMPLAPSLDTPGWFTRSAELLARVGELLLPGDGGRWAARCCGWRRPGATPTPRSRALAGVLERLQPLLGPPLPIQAVPEGIDALYSTFRAIQAQEAWASLGPWIAATRPNLSPAVATRFEAARRISDAEVQAAWGLRQRLQARLRPLLAGGAVLIYPTSPCPAPRLDAAPHELEEVRAASVGVTSIGGLAGLPEVTLPVARVATEEGEAPVGLSLVAAPGRDRALLALAREAATLLGLS